MTSPSYTYTLTNGTTADASQVQQNFTDILNGVTDGTKDLSISALTCAGTATLNGHVNLGNASADDLTITASLASSIPIKTTNSFDIGSATLGLRAAYFGANSQTTKVVGSASMSATWTLTLPVSAGTANYALITDGSGVSSWSSWTNSAWKATGAAIGTVSSFAPTRSGAVKSTSADYQVLDADGYDIILVTTSTNPITITLPAIATNVGRILSIKKVDAGSGTIVVDGNASETIDGTTTVGICFQYDTVLIECDSTGWYYIGPHYESFRVLAPTITNAGTSPSGYIRGVKIGRDVAISAEITTGASGSPTTPAFASAEIPSNFRVNVNANAWGELDTATDTWYRAETGSSGNITFYRQLLAGSTDIASTNWANAATKTFHFKYILY